MTVLHDVRFSWATWNTYKNILRHITWTDVLKFQTNMTFLHSNRMAILNTLLYLRRTKGLKDNLQHSEAWKWSSNGRVTRVLYLDTIRVTEQQQETKKRSKLEEECRKWENREAITSFANHDVLMLEPNTYSMYWFWKFVSFYMNRTNSQLLWKKLQGADFHWTVDVISHKISNFFANPLGWYYF
jgi:hypothetical protein